MNTLHHINQDDFKRLLKSDLTAIEKTRIFSTLARINTLYMIAKAGSGHIGSSFSSMDIFSWLHLNVLEKDDVFFSSKGHDAPGLYSILIGCEKLAYDGIHKLRRLHGLPGHPDVGTTPCMVTNTGSLGMGVSKAKGMVRANRLNKKDGRVYVLTGDGELQEGQFWESLPGAVNGKFEEITVIVDHNKIQSDTWVSDVSDLGDLEAKFKSYGWHVQRCDGNNFEVLSKAIDNAKLEKDKPQIIIADTVKGCGISFMEASTSMPGGEEFYAYHSGAPSLEDYERAAQELIGKANVMLVTAGYSELNIETMAREILPTPKGNIHRLIPAYEKALNDLGGQREDIVVMDADLMIDCGLLGFRNNFPERFVECGIAEQDMVSQAGGLALNGKLPIAHSFACFLAPRANEQISNNASEHTKCIYTGSLAGILPAGPGHSHQMVRDISALGGIPGLILLEPCCEAEVAMVLEYAVEKNPQSTYIRLVTIPCEIPFDLPPDYILEEGKGIALTGGEDAVLFSYGPVMLPEAYKAADILKKEHDFGLKVINLPWLNKFDKEWLKNTIGNTKQVFTLDNHLLDGGQGERVAAVMTECGLSGKISLMKLGLTEIPECGRNDEIMAHHGLDSLGIVEKILLNINKVHKD
ncbi:MAG: transketolase, partial [Candidatus Scalindua sp.]|nr:transketolase [Candidatus Scalindua sp.]